MKTLNFLLGLSLFLLVLSFANGKKKATSSFMKHKQPNEKGIGRPPSRTNEAPHERFEGVHPKSKVEGVSQNAEIKSPESLAKIDRSQNLLVSTAQHEHNAKVNQDIIELNVASSTVAPRDNIEIVNIEKKYKYSRDQLVKWLLQED